MSSTPRAGTALSRFTRLALGLWIALVACKDSPSPLAPDPTPRTGTFELELPGTIIDGEPFDLTVTAVAENGNRPDRGFTGSVSLSASAGTVTPSTLMVTEGVGGAQVRLSGHSGSANVTASVGSASGSQGVTVLGRGAVARIEIVPGSFLLTEEGQSRQLEARAFDGSGQPVVAEVVWRSSDPSVLELSSGGLATAKAGVGSAQVTAEVNGVGSVPAFALIAMPAGGVASASAATLQAAGGGGTVNGAILVDDDQVVDGIAAVDPMAPYEPGWRYRVRLRGVSPTIGQIVLASGEAPIGGRTVAVQPDGTDVLVTLELVPLSEMFDRIAISETFSLIDAAYEVPEEVAQEYDVQRSPDGTMIFAPRGEIGVSSSFMGHFRSPQALTFADFNIGSVKCRTSLVGSPLQFRVVPRLTIRPSLTYSVEHDEEAGGLRKLALTGGVSVTLLFDPRLTARLTQKIDCNAELARLRLPIGGPASLLLGGHLPIGYGLEFEGATTLSDLTLKGYVAKSASGELGILCRPDCSFYGQEPTVTEDSTSFEPVYPDPDEQFKIELRLFGYAFGKLAIGPPIKSLQAELIEVRSGLAQFFDLARAEVQVTNTEYASNARTSFFGQFKSGASINSALKFFDRQVATFELRTEVPFAETPRGRLRIEPAVVRAGNDSDPGELATFTVEFDRWMYGPAYGIDEVLIRWLRNGELEPARGSCSRMEPEGDDQRTFTCQTYFLEEHEGTQAFYAFVKPKIFGVPLPFGELIPMETDKDTRATLRVSVGGAEPIPDDDGDPTNDEGDGQGSSWGDPHLVTLDGLAYDFMAVGDFVLVRSTDPGHDLEIQTRYRRPDDADDRFSWNEAVAMRVGEDVVEVYARANLTRDIVINGDRAIRAEGGMNLRLPAGGVLLVEEDVVNVVWPGPRRATVEIRPTRIPRVLASVNVLLGAEWRSQVEGLLGDFDGNNRNDLRVRGGDVLNNPSTSTLYQDFRVSWRVPYGSAESLFSQGAEQFDPTFPPGVVSLDDLAQSAAERARDVCVAAGVLDSDILRACILDVVLTGDDDWAYVAAGVDPTVLGVTISPRAAYLRHNDSRQFGAVVTGTADKRVSWSVSGGTFRSDSDNVMTYFAPAETGVYTITGTLAADGSHVSTATVYVSEIASGFSRQWTGAVGTRWDDPRNWTPTGVPDSTDNVYIPAGTLRPAMLAGSSINLIVHDIFVEPGASLTGSSRLTVRGDAAGDFPFELWMSGTDVTLRGNVELLRVAGSVSAAGTIRVDHLDLTGGDLRPAGNRIEVKHNLRSFWPQGGRLVMENAADHLLIHGDLDLGALGSREGTLTAGTLEVRGNVNLADDHVQFRPTGTHRLLLSGSEKQIVGIPFRYVLARFYPPSNRILNHVEVTNPDTVVISSQAMQIDGTVTVRAGTVVTVGTNARVHLVGNVEDEVGGWRASTVLRNPEPRLPAVWHSDLAIGGGGTDQELEVSLGSDLEVTGSLTVDNHSALRVGGRMLRIGGNLTTVGDGSLVMDSESDQVIVRGNSFFGASAVAAANAGAMFSAGRFEIEGNLTERFDRFRARGTHRTVFSGSSPQTVTIDCYYTNCLPYNPNVQRNFQHVEIRGGAEVAFSGKTLGINGGLTVRQGASVAFSNVHVHGSVDLHGELSVPENRVLGVTDTLYLRSTSTLNNAGTVEPGTCVTEEGHAIEGADPCEDPGASAMRGSGERELRSSGGPAPSPSSGVDAPGWWGLAAEPAAAMQSHPGRGDLTLWEGGALLGFEAVRGVDAANEDSRDPSGSRVSGRAGHVSRFGGRGPPPTEVSRRKRLDPHARSRYSLWRENGRRQRSSMYRFAQSTTGTTTAPRTARGGVVGASL